ncbi:hypothetical protein AN958_04422 [Leucoagaricus sp. SymC.cos]|nr:hypothetical protein AN958_04422 [Leucoagaricus sp. SymC.cos]
MTIQPGSVISDGEASDTATIFEAFKEVSLDLTFAFSTQNSPAASITELPLSNLASPVASSSIHLPPSSMSAEAAPSMHNLSRTMSFASQLAPLSPLMKTKKKFKSAKFSSDHSSILRGSWPAIKYVGRGTPVDRNRRKEWSGLSAENVGEDGLLFSNLRANSLDSRSPRLSSSSDWDFLNPGLPGPGSPLTGRRSASVHQTVEEEGMREEERIPPLQKIEIKLESGNEDWASVMETVLSSAEKGKEGEGSLPITEKAEVVEEKEVENRAKVEDSVQETQLPPEEVDKLQSELQFDINIDKALDLGFNPAGDGGTLFTLAAITDSDNSNLTVRRTTTMSSHSRYSTPSEGPSDNRPLAAAALTPSTTNVQDSKPSTTRVFSDIRSTTSTKADIRVAISRSPKTEGGLPWWRKALGRLKRVQALLRPHRNTC